MLGLSTWAPKPDSLDPDLRSEFNVVLRELHTACRLRSLHCWTGSHVLSWQTVTQLGSGSRLFTSKVVLGSRSKVPCEEPMDIQVPNINFFTIIVMQHIKIGNFLNFAGIYNSLDFFYFISQYCMLFYTV